MLQRPAPLTFAHRIGLVATVLVVTLVAAPAAGAPAAGAGTASVDDLLGLRATYDIAFTRADLAASTSAQHDGGELASQDAATATTWVEGSASATSTVVDVTGDVLTIATTLSPDGGGTLDYVHRVPLDAVVGPVAGEPQADGYLDVVETTPPAGDGETVTVERRSQVGAGWLQAFAASVAVAGAQRGRFAVTLTEHGAAGVDVPDGHALLLLPLLMGPEDLASAQVEDGDADGDGTTTVTDDGGAVTAQATTAWAGNRLLTIDNPLADIEVWQSDFTHEGFWSTTLIQYEIEVLAEPLFFNWTAISAEAWFGTVTTTSAEGFGQTAFLGVFVRGPLWWGEGWHRIDLRETNHDTWLRGTIWQFGCQIWNPWKDEWFLQNDTHTNGQRLADDWYIVESTAEWLAVIFGVC